MGRKTCEPRSSAFPVAYRHRKRRRSPILRVIRNSSVFPVIANDPHRHKMSINVLASATFILIRKV